MKGSVLFAAAIGGLWVGGLWAVVTDGDVLAWVSALCVWFGGVVVLLGLASNTDTRDG